MPLRDLDMRKSEVLRDRQGFLDVLMKRPPIFWSAASNSWIISSYSITSDVLRDPRFMRQMPNAATKEAEGFVRSPYDLQNWPVFAKGPTHLGLRKALAELLLTVRHNLDMSRIGSIAEDTLQQVLSRGPQDITLELAVPYIWKLVETAFAISEPSTHEIQHACQLLDPIFSFLEPTPSDVAGGYAAFSRLQKLTEHHWRTGAYHQLSGDTKEHSAMMGYATGILLYGFHETVARLIANSVFCLVQNQRQTQTVLQDLKSENRQIIEEVLRYLGPTLLLPRTALARVHVGDCTIGIGDRVLLVIAASNRDPSVFANPATFEIGRRNAGLHLSFGAGSHVCPASEFAKSAASAMLFAMVKRWHSLRIDCSKIHWRHAINSFGVEGLEISSRTT